MGLSEVRDKDPAKVQILGRGSEDHKSNDVLRREFHRGEHADLIQIIEDHQDKP